MSDPVAGAATTVTATATTAPPAVAMPIEQPILGGHLSTILLCIVLVLVVVFFVRVMIRENNNPASPIYLRDLITKGGVVYLPYVVLMVGLTAASWVVIYATFKGTLTDAEYCGYLTAVIGPAVTAIYKGNDPLPPQPSPLLPPVERKAAAAQQGEQQ